MTINYAVDRLYQTGWLPTDNSQLERLPIGLRYPTVAAVVRLFEDVGLELLITPHLMFGCYRAEWKAADGSPAGADMTGTVVGSCEAEAAVYALAKLREQQLEMRANSGQGQLALAGV